MAIAVTLEIADYSTDALPGFRDSRLMDATQSVPANNEQDSSQGILLTELDETMTNSTSYTNAGVDTPDADLFTVGDIILIGTERMEVAAIVDSGHLTVQRAVEGTNVIAHAINDGVRLFVRWQLQVDRITHNFQTPAIPLPLPTTGQGDQVLNKMIDIGMRSENIRCAGVLRDVGIPSMRNVRKQTLLDICRVQHAPTIGLSGEQSKPSNPNAYLRLTIGSGHEPSDYTNSVGGSVSNPTLKINTNLVTRDRNNNGSVVGSRTTAKSYRGLITDITFELEGGRPDIWQFNFSFYVVKNEHDYVDQG